MSSSAALSAFNTHTADLLCPLVDTIRLSGRMLVLLPSSSSPPDHAKKQSIGSPWTKFIILEWKLPVTIGNRVRRCTLIMQHVWGA